MAGRRAVGEILRWAAEDNAVAVAPQGGRDPDLVSGGAVDVTAAKSSSAPLVASTDPSHSSLPGVLLL
ncbi:hypothetical protein [Streptomyces olivaceoviridis]|uniref:hypothetical protein n=1 Tax=Streptomyces olivaceoviridis TaxID=1921 RepID=UPI00331AB448